MGLEITTVSSNYFLKNTTFFNFSNNVAPTELIEFDNIYNSTIMSVLRTCISHVVAIVW